MATSPIMTVMLRAVVAAGRGLRRDFGEVENLQVSRKGPGDFVSAADRKAEETLARELLKARPDYGLVMEEQGVIEGRDPEHRFIVDPLDGTTNFLHGMPHFAVSVALEKGDAIIAAVVYNPITDETFTAERGRGAFLNDRRLRVAARSTLTDSVIACGLPHLGRGDLSLFRRELENVQDRVAGLRRFGAASLDLAWVAAGRFDGYWERGLRSWDMAAGILLVREAGGYVSDPSGRDTMMTTGDIVAGNEAIHGALLKQLKSAA